MSQPTTSPLDRILAGECVDSTELARALEQAIPAAEEWLGSDIALELTATGWVARYRGGNSYRHTISGPWHTPFASAEDAIQALVDRAGAARAKAAAEELAL